MTARTAPTLRERVTEPGLQRAVRRQRARLDAEEAGWAVMEPGVARALLAVARAARRVARAMNLCTLITTTDLERLRRADARLVRTRAPRGAGKRSGRP